MMEIETSDVLPKAKVKLVSNVKQGGKLNEHSNVFGVFGKETELFDIIDGKSVEVLGKRNLSLHSLKGFTGKCLVMMSMMKSS